MRVSARKARALAPESAPVGVAQALAAGDRAVEAVVVSASGRPALTARADRE
jgi:hypothetical protein